jgi:hypothetical protein
MITFILDIAEHRAERRDGESCAFVRDERPDSCSPDRDERPDI